MTEEITKVWKVMNLSARSCSIELSDFKVWYKKKEWTHPKLGKLFAFKTYEDACNWRMRMSYPCDYTLHLCDAVVDWSLTEVIVYIPTPWNIDWVMRFWHLVSTRSYREIHKDQDFGIGVPEGTVFCDKIMRLRECDVGED